MLSALIRQQVSTISEDAAAQFTAGYLYGVTAQDKRDYIVSCFANNTTLNETLDQMNKDLIDKNWDAVKKDSDKTQPLYETAMAGCDEVSSIEEALKKYESDFWAQENAQEIYDANAEKYAAQIEESLKNWTDRWNLGVYFDAGMFAGYVNQYLGTAPPYGELNNRPVDDTVPK